MGNALLNIENGFIEPRDRVRFNTNFPTWKKKRIRLLKWEDTMTLKVRIQGNKQPVKLGNYILKSLGGKMTDKVEGFLEVGCNEKDEIVVNHPDLKPDENGVGHIVFSPNQARNLAQLLLKNAEKAEQAIHKKAEEFRIKSLPPVDRSARTLLDGSPVTEDHRAIQPSGMQKDYVVLSTEERSKGFVRPVRRTYRHKTCNSTTSMGTALAETYARDPKFYDGTFCVLCGTHFPLDQFVWEGTDEQVGT